MIYTYLMTLYQSPLSLFLLLKYYHHLYYILLLLTSQLQRVKGFEDDYLKITGDIDMTEITTPFYDTNNTKLLDSLSLTLTIMTKNDLQQNVNNHYKMYSNQLHNMYYHIMDMKSYYPK